MMLKYVWIFLEDFDFFRDTSGDTFVSTVSAIQRVYALLLLHLPYFYFLFIFINEGSRYIKTEHPS